MFSELHVLSIWKKKKKQDTFSFSRFLSLDTPLMLLFHVTVPAQLNSALCVSIKDSREPAALWASSSCEVSREEERGTSHITFDTRIQRYLPEIAIQFFLPHLVLIYHGWCTLITHFGPFVNEVRRKKVTKHRHAAAIAVKSTHQGGTDWQWKRDVSGTKPRRTKLSWAGTV